VPGDGAAFVDREVAERFTKWLLPVPLGPTYTKRFCSVDPLQGAQRVLGLGRDRRAVRFPSVEGLAGGEPGCTASRPDRRLVAPGGLLGEQDPQDLGVVPALRGRAGDHFGRRVPDVWEQQAPQQPVEL
jgi:hypothetical protein